MRNSLVCLAATLALCACGRSTPSKTAADAPSSRPSNAEAQPALPAPTLASEASSSDALDASPAPSASESASETPLVALAPPVKIDPAAINAQPLPIASGVASAAGSGAGAKASPTGGLNPPAATETSFAPRDECAALPGWKGFRDKLGTAVAAHDAKALAGLADRNVKLDYGGGAGRAELIRRLRQPAGGLWRELAAILPLGCSVEGGLAAMPWFFWRIPPKVDPADTMLVTGDAVPLRAAPKADARTVTTLDWPMVTLVGPSFASTARFSHVRTRANGQDGYVETRRLRSLLARRIIAEQSGGEWRITAIVAGD